MGGQRGERICFQGLGNGENRGEGGKKQGWTMRSTDTRKKSEGGQATENKTRSKRYEESAWMNIFLPSGILEEKTLFLFSHLLVKISHSGLQTA